MNQERKPLIKTDYWADDIGRNGGPKRIHVCPECRGEVVWAKNRAGKSYLADVGHWVTQGGRTRKIYNAGVAHFATCKERVERGKVREVAADLVPQILAAIHNGDNELAEKLAEQLRQVNE